VPDFAYRAIDPRGKRLSGYAEAPTGAVLSRSLEDRGLVVVDVTEAAESDKRSAVGLRLSARELVEATRALAALLPAGLPLAKALQAAANLTSGRLAETLQVVRRRVERGDALATALAEHPEVFPPMYVGLVRAGERSGDLDGAFARLATQLERDEELRAKLVSAAIYPSLLAIVGGAAVLVLLLLVIPRFGDLLQGAGATMPRTTAIVLALSQALRDHWPLFLVPVVGIALFASWTRNSPQGARVFATMLLKLPLLRTMRRELLAARFARITSVLVAGGAPLLAALDDVTDSMGDAVARDDVARIRERVREGVALNRAIAEGALFPPLLAQLVSVGEEAGRLQEFLAKAAELFERRTERAAARLVALAEPTMIVLFGVIVGFVALSLLQAIYGVNAGSFR
jgi:type II secretory pathway component PulF